MLNIYQEFVELRAALHRYVCMSQINGPITTKASIRSTITLTSLERYSKSSWTVLSFILAFTALLDKSNLLTKDCFKHN